MFCVIAQNVPFEGCSQHGHFDSRPAKIHLGHICKSSRQELQQYVLKHRNEVACRESKGLAEQCRSTTAPSRIRAALLPGSRPFLLHYNAGAAALQTAHMPTTPPAQYTISEYPVSRLLFASHICSKGFHKAFLPCAADLQSLPFYGYDQLIHTLHMRQIYQIAVVALIVMPLRELFLGAFQ